MVQSFLTYPLPSITEEQCGAKENKRDGLLSSMLDFDTSKRQQGDFGH